MKNIKPKLKTLIYRTINLLAKAIIEIQKIKELILNSGITEMFNNIFKAIEAMFRATIYFLILLMGLSVTGFGAYTILFLTLRIGQFLYQLIFKDKWL